MRLRTTDISARTIDGETILLDLRGSRYLSVAGVGTRIVELLADHRTMDDLVGAIATEYDAAPAVIRSDAEHFIGRLRGAGLLED